MCLWFIVELETEAETFALVICKHLWLSERGMKWNDHFSLCFILSVQLEEFLLNQQTIASFHFPLRSGESKDVNRKENTSCETAITRGAASGGSSR